MNLEKSLYKKLKHINQNKENMFQKIKLKNLNYKYNLINYKMMIY